MAKSTLKRIAELAGVSTTTVSYVLNNRPGISEATRNRIREIMEQEDYSPNANTLRLSARRSRNIYLIIDEFVSFGNLFYSVVLDSLTLAAEKYNYTIVVSNKHESFQASAAARAIQEGLADGLVFFHDLDPESLQFVQQHQIPFVVIDSHRQDAPYIRVCVDYDMSTYVVTKHLIDLGHRRIAFIGQAELPDFYIATFRGCCRALTEHKLLLHPQWLQSDACDFESAYQSMENILKCDELPTGIVCATDLFALAAMQCAQNNGYKIPADFSVVGIDDLNNSKIFFPSLTTIYLDPYDLAAQAMQLLHNQIETQDLSSTEYVTVRSDQLVIRNSSGPAPR